MTTKTTKRALLMSALALFLCFSMLIGTTFAWFTDEVKSATNIIAAGNLDVELYNGLDTTALKVGPTTALFDEVTLWEPGVVAYENLTVENKGNLALKYQLAVNIVDLDGLKSLADVLKVAVVENGVRTNDRKELIASINNWMDFTSFVEAGELDEDETKTYGLVIWWEPSDKDNDYNMNNENQGQVLSAEIGIVLEATQLVAEEDSFGPDYDEDAWADGMQIYTADDLKDALANGETNIVLMKDITLDAPIVIPAAPTTYSLRTNAVVIDLNGKTLTGKMHKNDGSVIKNQGSLILKNGTVSSTANNGGSAIVNNGTLVVENVTLNGAPNADGSWPSYTVNNTGVMTAENVKITSYHGAVSSYGEGAVVTLNDCEIDMAGIPGFTSHGIYTYNNGAVVVNGGVYANKATDQAASGASVINGKVTINGGTFTGRIENYYGTPVIKGGTFSVNPKANFVAEGFETLDNNDGTYTVYFPQESFDKLIDNAQADDTVEIPAGTYTFPASKLQAGMTLNCAEGTVFKGQSKLNINGATVIGATFSNPTGTAADQTINGTFKNCVFEGKNGLRWCYAGDTVVFEDCVFSGSTYGVHFDGGANEVIFRRCTFSGFNAMAGAIELATFEDCTFKSNGKSGYNGINMWGSTEMTNCTFVFDGSVSYEWVDACGDNKTHTFTNCVVTDGKTEKGVETVVGDYGTGNTIIVDGAPLVFSNTALNAAIANGATKVLLADGEYDLNGNQKNGLTLVGVGDNVKMANTTQYAGGKAVGAITKAIHLENVTITNTVYTMENGGNATFTNVYFAAGFRQGYGKAVVFNNCTFGSNSEGYALHFQTDSASEGGVITLNGCKFEGGKVHLGGKRAYTFTGCDFAAGTDFQIWSNITLENCTVNGEKVTAENMATLFPKLDATKVTLK